MRHRASNHDLRRRCKTLLRDLEVDPPFEIEKFCTRLGEARGTPIRLFPWNLPVPGPFGLWMSRPHEDCIFYQEQTTPAHQQHIILHEIGHIIAQHDSDLAVISPPDFDPALPGDLTWRGLRRTCYSDENEREAEEVASTILDWVATVDYLIPQQPPSPFDGLYRALNSRQGWL